MIKTHLQVGTRAAGDTCVIRAEMCTWCKIQRCDSQLDLLARGSQYQPPTVYKRVC